jgi:hypothetical protein
MDFMGGLFKTRQEHDYLFLVVDRLKYQVKKSHKFLLMCRFTLVYQNQLCQTEILDF